jgi:hypothetical protein
MWNHKKITQNVVTRASRLARPKKTKGILREKNVETQSIAPIQSDIEKSLDAIYRAPDGSLPDFSSLERKTSFWWMRLVFGTVAVLAILSSLAWIGLFVFKPFQKQETPGLALSIKGPDQVMLGKEETFTIDWLNKEMRPMTSAEVRVSLPHEFTPTSFDPLPQDGTLMQWKLGLLQAQAKGTITVKGVFLGELGAKSALQAIGAYRFSEGDTDHEAISSLAIAYTSTAIEGKLMLPEKVVPGDLVQARYVIKNRGTQLLNTLLIHFTLPDGFTAQMASSSGDVRPHEVFIPLPSLPPEATATINLSGLFSPSAVGDATFQAAVGKAGMQDVFLSLQQTDAKTTVLAGDFVVRPVVNGTTGDQTVEPGDPLRVTIGYQNTSAELLKDVWFTIGFESIVNGKSATGTSILAWKDWAGTISGSSTSTRTRIQTLTYDKKVIPTFASMDIGGEGTIEFALPTLLVATGTKDAAVVMTVQAHVGSIGKTKVNRLIQSVPLTIRYRTDADASVLARYFTEEGAPIGSGPLPPIAGKTTSYRVMWHLTKTLHALDRVEVSAVLPRIATWGGKEVADQGTVRYDEATRRITWTMDHVAEGTSDITAQAEIQVTPETTDVGRFAALFGETQFQAIDALTKETISHRKPALSTDLSEDEAASRKGVVRKE